MARKKPHKSLAWTLFYISAQGQSYISTGLDPSIKSAVLAVTRGTKQRPSCKNCATGSGVFTECMTVPGFFKSSGASGFPRNDEKFESSEKSLYSSALFVRQLLIIA